MKRKLLALICSLWASTASAGPQDAVVRLPSHGASATVVWVGQGKSLILGCAHAFQGAGRNKAVTIDAPSPNPGAAQRPGVKVLKVDYDADLSLLEVNAELPYVCPVAPVGHRPGRLLSAGYDEMRWPATQRSATLLGSSGSLTYTREKPWHGRSGGALIDLDAGYLVGVVQGYEATGNGRGMYASHAAITRFLGWSQTPLAAQPQGRPYVTEQREYSRPSCPSCPGGNCPGGICLPGSACPGGACPPGYFRPGGT